MSIFSWKRPCNPFHKSAIRKSGLINICFIWHFIFNLMYVERIKWSDRVKNWVKFIISSVHVKGFKVHFIVQGRPLILQLHSVFNCAFEIHVHLLRVHTSTRFQNVKKLKKFLNLGLENTNFCRLQKNLLDFVWFSLISPDFNKSLLFTPDFSWLYEPWFT